MSETTGLHLRIEVEGDQAVAALRRIEASADRLRNKLETPLKRTLLDGFERMETRAKASGAAQTEIIKRTSRAAEQAFRKSMAFNSRIGAQRNSEEKRAEVAADRLFRQSAAFQSRMASQRAKEERQAEESAERIFRQSVVFQNRMASQRAREERQIADAAERSFRRAERDHRANLSRLATVQRAARRDGRSNARQGVSRISHAASTLASPAPVIFGAATAAAIAKASQSSLGARIRVDTAETNLRMFGGMSQDDIGAMRKTWGNGAAIRYGLSPDRLLSAFTETLKAGIPMDAAREVTENILKGATGLDLDPEAATQFTGRISTLLQDVKNFDPSFIKDVLNSVAVVAKETAADANEIVAGLRRGTGAFASTKIKAGELASFIGVAESAGMQSGKAGTFAGFFTSELASAGKARGQRAKDLGQAAQMLGFGSRQNLAMQMANDPTATSQRIFAKMATMDEQRRTQVAGLLGMREWRDEILTMVKVRDDLARALKAIADNPNFLDQASAQRLASLAGKWNSLKSAFSIVWESFGSGFEGMFREVTAYLTEFAAKANGDYLKAHVEAVLFGFLNAFGVTSWTQLLEKTFEKPGQGIDRIDAFFRFARGFATGLKQTWGTFAGALHGLAKRAGVDTTDPEAFGRFAAGILGMSAALQVAKPVLSVFGAISGLLLGVGNLALALRGLSAAGMSTGLLAFGSRFMSAFLPAIGLALIASIDQAALARQLRAWTRAFGQAIWDGLRSISMRDVLSNLIDPNFARWMLGRDPNGPPATTHEKLQERGPWDTFKDIFRSDDEIRKRYAPDTGSVTTPDSARRFAGPSLGNAAPYKSGAGNGLFDAIINAEGTAKQGNPYDTSLGYLKSPKPLSQMTMAESLAWGDQIRKNTEIGRQTNSSAKGAFQIVNTTQRKAMAALGIRNDELFDETNQKRMAEWIARRQGLRAWEGFKLHPVERTKAAAAMAGGSARTQAASSLKAVPFQSPAFTPFVGSAINPQVAPPTAQSIVRDVSAVHPSADGTRAGARSPTVTVNASFNINGAGKDAKEIAQEVQRHISEAMNWRTHDVEPTLA